MKMESSIHINRLPAEVFAFATDVSHDKEWQDGVIDSRIEGAPGVGAKMISTRTMLGQKMENVGEITVWEPPMQVRFRVVSGPMKFEGGMRFEEMDGGTHMTMGGEGEFAGFFKIADGLAAGQMKKQLEGELQRLKSILES